MRECTSVTPEQLSDLQDGALPLLVAWRIRHHLMICTTCAAEWQRLQQLQVAARTWQETKPLPTRFATSARDTVERPRRATRTSWQQGALLTGMAAALSFGAYLTFRAEMIAKPVEGSMGKITEEKIRNAQWVYNYVLLDSSERQITSWTAKQYIQLNPPAIRTEYIAGDRGKTQVSVLEPGRSLLMDWDPILQKNTYNLETTALSPYIFRHNLESEILAGKTVVIGGMAQKKETSTPWKRSPENLDLQYEREITLHMRGKKEYFHVTVRYDPETKRVVEERYESQPKDKFSNRHMIYRRDFRYNQSLPDSYFSTIPPSNSLAVESPKKEPEEWPNIIAF